MAITGNGDIASVLKGKWFEQSIQFIFFASGVSDSLSTDEKEFNREAKLLLQQDIKKHIVYFSTLSINYKKSPYTIHKENMEDLIKDNFKRYTIIRIGNITWGKNPKTILNFIRNKIKNNEEFEIQDVYRNVINEEDLFSELNKINFSDKKIVHLMGRALKVKEIVELIKKGEL